MIKVSKLDKYFGSLHALKKVSISVKKGAIYGLVGTNGSGKTTLLKHISGVFSPNSGNVTINGKKVYENLDLKQQIFFVPDDLYFFGNYTLKDMSMLYKGVYINWNQEKFDSIVDMLKLSKSKKVSRFSKGMQKQAVFALALATMPNLLILDEPVDGLDPLARRIIWDLIVGDVAEREMTVIISSHNIKEIEGICDTVCILSQGNVVLQRELDHLKSNVHKVQVAFDSADKTSYAGLKILNKDSIGSVDILIVHNSIAEIEQVFSESKPLLLDILPLTLEEIFIYELGGENNEYRGILS